ncbi:hypothetical protein KSP40_PGU014367 [Platanthera guangdongensis]|uniref:Uncharacterized protein n=1 Tax=Platanthera guangdongensis TaxID=2320717 RepID=A0ABR2MNB4_9ASPA
MKGEERTHQNSTFIYFLLLLLLIFFSAQPSPSDNFDLVGFTFSAFDFGFLAMDTFPSASVSRSLQENYHLELSPTGPAKAQGDGALSLEWLSIFMEDCLSGTTAFSIPQNQTSPTNNPPFSQPLNTKPSSNHMSKFPTKTKFKRRKLTLLEEEIIPLLPQTYWLAESKLLPKKDFATITVLLQFYNRQQDLHQVNSPDNYHL